MERAGGIFLSRKQEFSYQVVMDFLSGKLSRAEAAKLMAATERTVTRIARRIEAKGLRGVSHGNHARRPHNRKADEFKHQVMSLIEEKYFDFNMVHAREKLLENHGIEVSYSVLRRWCHEKRLVKRKKRRRARARFKRMRMSNPGLLLQFDGSHHHWNGSSVWCLIAAIDDATSEIPWAEFFAAEDTINCMTVMQRVIEKKGIPYAVYVDRAGWFGGMKRQMFCQFKRACEELGINVIFANSAQAKGRIERAWDTLQDRLIPEMRIRNIRRIPTANEYLQDDFLPNYWNAKNTVVPQSLESRYRTLPKGVDLNEIFCIKEYRTVKANHTLSWNGVVYKIDAPLKYSIQRQQIEFRQYQDTTWKAFFAGKPIALVPIADEQQPNQARLTKEAA